MGKEEEKGARRVHKDSRSGITPLLELSLETRDTNNLLERNGLIDEEEELLERLPGLQKDVCTVEEKKAASLPSIKQCLEYYFRREEVQKHCEICEKPRTSQSKDGEQIMANISESTSRNRAQAERDHHRKIEEKNNLLSDQDGTKQVGGYLDPRSGDRDNSRYLQVCGKEVPDVIREIASHLPCDLAISQMACSCSSWAAALRKIEFHVAGANAKLPWLQMPHPGGPVFFCISCGGDENLNVQHNIRVAEDQRWARYVSAFEGFWIVASGTRIGRNMIFNLRSGACFPLPNEVVHGGNAQQLILLAATLSGAPDKPNCIGMGIIKYLTNLQLNRRILFFTPGSTSEVVLFSGVFLDEPEDLSYHDSSFWILTASEQVHRLDMALHPDGDITMEKFCDFFFPDDLDHGDHVLGRYIVHSRGEVLMVIRLSSCGGGETTEFRIYKMTVLLTSKDEGDPTCCWNELGPDGFCS